MPAKTDKAVDYLSFYTEFFIACDSVKDQQFTRFRFDYPSMTAYVIEHAFGIWSDQYDKWDTITAYVINYVKCIETDKTSITANRNKWYAHAQLVRNLMIGA